MEQSHPTPGIKELLGIDSASHRGRRLRRWLGGGLLVLIAIAVAIWWSVGPSTEAPLYKTEPVTQADLTIIVTATGTLEPIVEVDVGSEVSGTLKSYSADFNDHVKAGQVLARLDTSKQQAQVNQSRAALQAAHAQVLNANATVVQTRLQAERLRRLVHSKIISEHDLEAADADYKRALAQREVARADEAKAKANLHADEITLSKMAIRSPINGIVLRRSIEVGQTVAASLQAPVLFTLADDLRKMQISLAVDEADVGKVKVGQSATFTVDAYPDHPFPARVTEVRYAPVTVAGVVTYETLLGVNNNELLLRPGMTATANITTAQFKDALLVPNAALRFTPPKTTQGGASRSWVSSLLGRRRHVSPQPLPAEPKGPERVVWTMQGDQPVAIHVKVGQTDGRVTQVLSGQLKPGMPLLVDLARNPT